MTYVTTSYDTYNVAVQERYLKQANPHHGTYLAIERARDGINFTLLEGCYPVRNNDRVVGIMHESHLMDAVRNDSVACGYTTATLVKRFPHSCIPTITRSIVIDTYTVIIVDKRGRHMTEQKVTMDTVRKIEALLSPLRSS